MSQVDAVGVKINALKGRIKDGSADDADEAALERYQTELKRLVAHSQKASREVVDKWAAKAKASTLERQKKVDEASHAAGPPDSPEARAAEVDAIIAGATRRMAETKSDSQLFVRAGRDLFGDPGQFEQISAEQMRQIGKSDEEL
jgi:hypothetical protein